MKVDDSLSNYAYDFIKKICVKFGPRYSSSDAEKEANLWIKEEFNDYCDETYVEEFKTNPNLYPQGIIKMCGFLGGMSFLFMPLMFPFSILSAVCIFLLIFVLYSELFLIKRWIKIFFKKGTSSNVWGRIKPSGPVKFRIILEGHTDSAKMMRLVNGNKEPPMKIFAIGILYLLFTLIMSILKFILQLLIRDSLILAAPLSGLIQWTVIDWIYFVPWLFLFPCFLYLLYGLTGKAVVDGANDNLSGSAVAAAVGKYYSSNRLKNVELIIASMGSEEIGDQGAKAWVDKHGDLLKNAYAYVIDSAGAGKELFIIRKDGMHRVIYTSEVIERMNKAYELHKQEYPDAISLGEGNISIGSSDACMYIRGGFKSAFIIVHEGDGLKKPPHWHSMTDQFTEIDKKVLRDTIGMALNFVKLVDEEYDE